MKQIPLDLSADQPQSFDTFVTGRNEELLQRLQQLAAPGADKSAHAASASTDRFVYLWAEAGAGKSHLLHATALQAGGNARLIPAGAPESAFDYHPQVSHYLIDDADEFKPEWLAGAKSVLVTAGASAPDHLVNELLERLQAEFGAYIEQRTLVKEDIDFDLPKSVKQLPVLNGR